MELIDLEQKIIKTLARFDTIDRPLTFLELLNFLDQKLSAQELQTQLSSQAIKQFIKEKNGWYYLAGREDLIDLKNKRYRLSSDKLRIAQRASRYLRYFPWIRGIAVYSSLALKNSRDESDIDLFFITSNQRTWSARFFVNVALKLMRLRPSEKNTKNKLCPSYFADENHLDLSVVNQINDYYYYYLGPATFIFLYEAPRIRENFIRANKWIADILPNWLPPESIARPESAEKIKLILEKILSPLSEKKLKRLQLRIMPTRYLKCCDGKKVILDDGIIKLHDNDKREASNSKFEDRIKETLHA